MIDAGRRHWFVRIPAYGLGAFLAADYANVIGMAQGEPRKATVTGPAGQLYVDDGGEGGLPVLFVHSFAGSTVHWQRQLTHLRVSRRAVAMDWRGHGRSDPPRGNDYTVQGLAADIAAVADALALQRFVLVGHSMGGAAAAAYAGKHPGRLAGLVLVGTPGKSAAQQSEKILASLNADYDKVMAAYWNALLAGALPQVRTMLESNMRTMQREPSLAMISAVFAYDPLPDLAAYTGPKLIIDTTDGEDASALYRQAPQIPRVLINGTSHWPQLDKPQEFDRVLDSFLAQLPQ